MNALPLFHIILLFSFVLILKVPLSVSGIIFENNPFYGLSNDPIRSIESITDDNLIRVKLEYTPSAIQIGSPEFFRATLFYNEKNEIVLHADTNIAISKNGKELYKASSEFSQPFVHTPNGIVLSSYKFPDSGQYIITAEILGINFMPVNPKQVDFIVNVTESNDKYNIEIGK
jgi:hypothetical protein